MQAFQPAVGEDRLALFRLARVDEIHRREDAETARLSHHDRAEVQSLRHMSRPLRRNVESFQHLKSHRPESVINCFSTVDIEQAASQLNVGLEPEAQGIVRVKTISHAVFVSGEARHRLQQAKASP